MKKFSLFLGALVIGFILSSCNTNPKEVIQKEIDAFFDKEMTNLDAIDNPDDLVVFFNEFGDRFSAWAAKMNSTYPCDDNNVFVGMTKEEDDALMEHLDERINLLSDAADGKGSEMFEPYLARLEDVVYGLIDDLINDVEPADDIVDQIEAAYIDVDKYSSLANEEQGERLQEVYSWIVILFGLDEEE